jgi:hypothetical protein
MVTVDCFATVTPIRAVVRIIQGISNQRPGRESLLMQSSECDGVNRCKYASMVLFGPQDLCDVCFRDGDLRFESYSGMTEEGVENQDVGNYPSCAFLCHVRNSLKGKETKRTTLVDDALV